MDLRPLLRFVLCCDPLCPPLVCDPLCHAVGCDVCTGDEEDDSEEWEEGDDDEIVGTPLDDMDAFVSFAEVLSGLQTSMPARYSAAVAGADAAALQALSAHAAQVQAKKAAEQQQQQQ